jgi:hypothetical protein
MPYYTFDLVVGDEFRNQGTIILEDLHVASDRADQLADELSQVKPELKAKGCAVRVIDVNTGSSIARRSIPCRSGRGFSDLRAVARPQRTLGGSDTCRILNRPFESAPIIFGWLKDAQKEMPKGIGWLRKVRF